MNRVNTCKECNKEFSSIRIAKHCSAKCRAKYHYINNKECILKKKKEYFQVYKRSECYQLQLKKKQVDHYDDKNCKQCSIVFTPRRKDMIYCGQKCGLQHYRDNNKDRIKEDMYNRYHNDIKRRLSTNIRSRVNKALKGAYKPSSIVGNLGCTPNELKIHLESRFIDGMNWENYGLKGWHIDHVEPLVKFDLTDPKEFKRACHYSNLQPLWAKDNLKKGFKGQYEERKIRQRFY